MKKQKYKALISSDWNECLSPSRPFDPILFKYPELSEKIHDIFKKYTSNQISYKEGLKIIKSCLPSPITLGDMDRYLREKFSVYPGVLEFIDWCKENNVLFMINTTGFIGYFQRAMSLGLLPHIKIISGSPFIRFNDSLISSYFLELYDTKDKQKNTQLIIEKYNIKKVILIGDSGGDGPHFVWGKQNGYILIGCMVKPSIISFCDKHSVKIDEFVGDYKSPQEKIDLITTVKKYIEKE
ncbi:hypothetical protein JCM12298_19460 [Desulfothermus naphthae]